MCDKQNAGKAFTPSGLATTCEKYADISAYGEMFGMVSGCKYSQCTESRGDILLCVTPQPILYLGSKITE